ncbi:MAG: hypothetical protein GX174_09215 [Lentisphaerae bacterium]|jgi:hypothetical protein|nr:hypothetical protein [Lentisphaerota bacterium]
MHLLKRCRSMPPLLAGLCCMFHAAVSAQEMSQEIQLVRGWNAVCFKISPGLPADDLFADWPVESVGVYDAAAFARTRQFDATGSSEGLPSRAVGVWHRQLPGDSEVFAIPANAVLLCFATDSFDTMIYGAPEALRYAWHPTGPEAVYNYIGFSVAPGATPSLTAYCSGLKLGALGAQVLYGQNPEAVGFGPVPPTTPVANGMVLAMTADKTVDWSGVFHVSPLHGVAFGSEATLQPLTIRNDAATVRRARISYLPGEAANAVDIPPRCDVLYRDVSGGATYTDWQTLSAHIEKSLQPGEVWKLTLALNREQFAAVAAGTRVGGLLRVEDVDGGSFFRTTVPLSAVSDGGAAGASAWPAGLWVADVKLDKVTQVVNHSKLVEAIPAGGNMTMRLPLHVDREGRMRLLQRVVVAGAANGDGTIATALYAGHATIPAEANQSMRISAVCLPVDQPVIAGEGTFGADARFGFAVGAHSAANPLRHALHPQHDGLAADFQTPAPLGDDFENYVSKVKPELFSIANTIHLTWDVLPAGAAPWSPEEKLQGKLSWDFDGLRREGTLRAQGRFTMRRVSPHPAVEGL